MLQLELMDKLHDNKNLMLKTIALKNRLGDVQDSKIKSRLQYLYGLIHLKLKSYAKAQYDFQISFQCQAARGDRKNAVNMLKRSLICNTLAFEELDMSNTNEVNVQKEEVLELVNLKKLSINYDIIRFLQCLECLNDPKYTLIKELKDDVKIE